jgi:glycosyltransferase involved in cell wall biosynthesis
VLENFTFDCYFSFRPVAMPPKISVIVPVYNNKEQYLRQCLDSIVNQTLPELQIICVNDGSTDGSSAVLEEYAQKDSRIEIINKPNGGISSARNAGLDSARGKYILFIDHDDWIEPETCRKTFQKAEEFDADIVLFELQAFDNKSKHRYFKNCPPNQLLTPLQIYNTPAISFIWCRLWKNNFIKENDLRFPEGLYIEDDFFCWTASATAKRVVLIPEIFYHYRSHLNSTSKLAGIRNEKFWFDGVPVYQKIGEFLQKNKNNVTDYEEFRNIFLRKKFQQFCYAYFHVRTLRSSIKQTILDSLEEDDIKFIEKTASLPLDVRDFYAVILNRASVFASLRNTVREIASTIKRPIRQLRYRIKSLFLRLTH